MADFKTELLRIIEVEIPELIDKVQAGAVDAETTVPYAAFSTPEEVPIRTIHGIAGYSTTFEISVFHSSISEVEKLKSKLINTLEGATLNSKICYYKSSESAFFHQYNLHSYTLTFRIL